MKNNKKTSRIQKKHSLPTTKEVVDGKSDIAKMLQEIIDGNITLETKRETIADKLKLIEDILVPLENHIINKKISYTDIAQVLKLKIDLDISTQTLRTFCQEHLGFKKLDRKKPVKKQDKGIGKSLKEENNDFNASEELSNPIHFD